MSGPAAGTLKTEALDRGAGRETNCGVKLCGPRRRPSLLAGEKNCGPASQGAARLSSTYRDCYRPPAEAGGPACLGYMRMHIGKQRRYVLRRPRRYAGQIFPTSTRIVRVAAGSGQPTNFEASAKFTSLGYSR